MAPRFPLASRLALCVLALVALLVALTLPEANDAAAHDGHADLPYDIEVRWAFSGDCSNPIGTCNVGTGRMFQLRAVNATPHGITFDEMQFAVEYSGVALKGTPDVDVAVVGCGPRTDPVPQPAGKAVAGCTHDPVTSTAVFGTFEFTCTPTPSSGHVLTLRVGTGDEETYLVDTLEERHSGPASRTVTINCVDTPYADMNLNAKGPNVSCDAPNDPDECDVDVGDQFTLAVETDNPPAGGYNIVATTIQYGGLLYKPAPDDYLTFGNEGAEEEFAWPDTDGYALRFPFEPDGTEGEVEHGGYNGDPHYAGNLLELAMTCDDPGAFVVALIAHDPPDVKAGSYFYTESGRVYLNSGDELTINCIAGAPVDTPTPAPVATPTSAPPPASPVSVGGIGGYPDVSGASGSTAWLLPAGAVAVLAGALGLAITARWWRRRPWAA